jgi:Zn-dependent protease
VRFFGVPLRFHPTSVALVLIGAAIPLGSGVGGVEKLSFWARLALGLVGAVVLIFSILWHERGHIFVASRYGVGCSGITLFMLGGMAHITSLPKTARASFWIAIAGPIASFVLGLAFSGASRLLEAMLPYESLAIQTLAKFVFLNFILGGFNLIPVFPLDGGRVLSSILWRMTKDEPKARVLGVKIGRGVIVGLFVFLFAPLVAMGTLHPISFMWYLLMALFIWTMQGAALERPM